MSTDTRKQTRSFASGQRGKTRQIARKRPGRGKTLLNVAVVAATLLIVLVCAVWIRGVRFYLVTSNSMAPTFEGSNLNRDRIVCWLLPDLYRRPRRWEVVIFHTPATAKSQVATRVGTREMRTPEETGVTIKRLAGLPGERLAIAGGDIWTRPPEGGAFVRRSKPEEVQRDMWIRVYDEDFSDVGLDEFLTFWHATEPGGMSVEKAGFLRLAAGSGLRYKPLSRNVGGVLPEVPGIPDRYVIPQDVTFACVKCGKAFPGFADSQKIQGRCPSCRTLNYEDSVAVYGYRSGLPDIGRHSAGDVIEGDPDMFRDHPYYFVSDLRVTLEFNPETAASACEIALSDDEGEVALSVGPGGIAVDGAPVHNVTPPAAGVWTSVEFHRADGYLRVYLDGGKAPAYSQPFGSRIKPDANSHNRTSGVAIRAAKGGVGVRNVKIDRDVHYFTGYEKAVLNYMGFFGEDGEIDVPDGTFFPLGDNTTVSFDGRSWGAIDEGLLMGTAVGIWEPKARRRFIH